MTEDLTDISPSDDEIENASPARSTAPMLFVALAILAGLLLLYVLVVQRGGSSVQAEAFPGVGQKLTGVSLSPLVGDGEQLGDEQLQGKVTLMNFWGPWCTYCRMEMPHLMKLKKNLADRPDFQLISVSCSADISSENLDELRLNSESYLDSKGFKLTVHSDPGAQTRLAVATITQLLNDGFPFPLTVVLDRTGVIRGVWPGYDSGIVDEMEQLVVRLLDEGKA